MRCFRKAAEPGAAKVQSIDPGDGAARDDAKTVKWYRKAVEQRALLANLIFESFPGR